MRIGKCIAAPIQLINKASHNDKYIIEEENSEKMKFMSWEDLIRHTY